MENGRGGVRSARPSRFTEELNGVKPARASRYTESNDTAIPVRPARNMEGDTGVRSVRPSRYTEEEAQTVEQAKRIHKDTTASAQRALKVSSRAPSPVFSQIYCSPKLYI